jgi:NADH-quinone oxidoreductase E subunit
MRTTLLETGKPFEFSPANQKKIKEIIAKYPQGRQASAVLPLLDLAQRQNDNWVSKEIVEKVAGILTMPIMRVFEVATFYTMFNLKPVGQYHIQVCRNTPCYLRGSDDILKACQEYAGVGLDERSADGLFSIVEVECMGACIHAPMVAINDDYHENLDPQGIKQILDDLKRAKPKSKK